MMIAAMTLDKFFRLVLFNKFKLKGLKLEIMKKSSIPTSKILLPPVDAHYQCLGIGCEVQHQGLISNTILFRIKAAPYLEVC